MADLIPPVPYKKFIQQPEVASWWDWFRRLRENINAFAANITAIITQITNVSASVANTSSSVGFTAVTGVVGPITDAQSLTTSGYPVFVTGNVNLFFFTTTSGVEYVEADGELYMDGNPLTSNPFSYLPTAVQGTGRTVSFNFPINWYFTPPAGNHTYQYRIQFNMYDNTGTLISSSGTYITDVFLYIKEVKT